MENGKMKNGGKLTIVAVLKKKRKTASTNKQLMRNN